MKDYSNLLSKLLSLFIVYSFLARQFTHETKCGRVMSQAVSRAHPNSGGYRQFPAVSGCCDFLFRPKFCFEYLSIGTAHPNLGGRVLRFLFQAESFDCSPKFDGGGRAAIPIFGPEVLFRLLYTLCLLLGLELTQK